MKTLTLFRHAKSSLKDNPAVADIDRPLNETGMKAAPKMGVAMRDRGIVPDLILCSPSVRTKQTLDLAGKAAWDVQPKIGFDERLYHASAATMLAIINQVAKGVSHTMIVGHNPGLHELCFHVSASELEGDKVPAAKFPTAALVQFAFETSAWRTVVPRSGQLTLFLTPRMLKAQ